MWNHQTAAPDRYELLKNWARENRKYMTPAEEALWNEVRANKLGHKFLRQHVIGDFIVDFVCRDDGLIVEVDGAYHTEPAQELDDESRTEILESLGFRVIRFTNEEVLSDIESVIEEIERYINN